MPSTKPRDASPRWQTRQSLNRLRENRTLVRRSTNGSQRGGHGNLLYLSCVQLDDRSLAEFCIASPSLADFLVPLRAIQSLVFSATAAVAADLALVTGTGTSPRIAARRAGPLVGPVALAPLLDRQESLLGRSLACISRTGRPRLVRIQRPTHVQKLTQLSTGLVGYRIHRGGPVKLRSLQGLPVKENVTTLARTHE